MIQFGAQIAAFDDSSNLKNFRGFFCGPQRTVNYLNLRVRKSGTRSTVSVWKPDQKWNCVGFWIDRSIAMPWVTLSAALMQYQVTAFKRLEMLLL